MQRGQQGTDLKQALAQERKERVSPSPNVGIACGPFSMAPSSLAHRSGALE